MKMEHLQGNYSSFDELIREYDRSLFTYDHPDKVVLICFYIPVFLLALIGNVLVLVMVCVQRSVRRNIANRFLVNLAVADLLDERSTTYLLASVLCTLYLIPVTMVAAFGSYLFCFRRRSLKRSLTIVCIPLTVSRHVYTPWLYGEFLCRAMGFLQGIYVEGSVLTIVCMSAERYIAIRHPMRIRTLCNEKRITQVILLTWVTAIITMIPLVIYRELYVEYPFIMKELLQIRYCLERWPSDSARKAYNIFLLFIVYIIPGIIVMVLYTRIGCSLWRQDHELQRANSCINNEARVMGSRRKLARMMIIVSLLFAICWMPYFILLVCSDFIREAGTQRIMNSVYPFALLLGHSNSAQNPILYCFMHKGFHNFVRNLFSCRCDKIKQIKSKPSYSSTKTRTSSPSSTKRGRQNKKTEEKAKLMIQIRKEEGKYL